MFKSVTNHPVLRRSFKKFCKLQAGKALSKLFALDRIQYKRLWPRYIADLKELKTSHPYTWCELQNGNIFVTKGEIPFVSIGADHACEKLNRMMKIHSVYFQ